jgi:hypothetical protein
MRPWTRPAFPFRTRAAFLRALARTVIEAPAVEDVGTIPYCDDGRALVGLPEEIAALGCASCVLLAVYAATVAYQAGRNVDLCCSVLGTETEHAWIRSDGVRRDPSVEGGAAIPPHVYEGGVIVPVQPWSDR